MQHPVYNDVFPAMLIGDSHLRVKNRVIHINELGLTPPKQDQIRVATDGCNRLMTSYVPAVVCVSKFPTGPYKQYYTLYSSWNPKRFAYCTVWRLHEVSKTLFIGCKKSAGDSGRIQGEYLTPNPSFLRPIISHIVIQLSSSHVKTKKEMNSFYQATDSKHNGSI